MSGILKCPVSIIILSHHWFQTILSLWQETMTLNPVVFELISIVFLLKYRVRNVKLQQCVKVFVDMCMSLQNLKSHRISNSVDRTSIWKLCQDYLKEIEILLTTLEILSKYLDGKLETLLVNIPCNYMCHAICIHRRHLVDTLV